VVFSRVGLFVPALIDMQCCGPSCSPGFIPSLVAYETRFPLRARVCAPLGFPPTRLEAVRRVRRAAARSCLLVRRVLPVRL